MNNRPIVSIIMITFNHERYISKAIEGVLIQKTNFNFELIIGEDCSNDNTANIVNKYAQKYPEIIKARFNNPNLGMMQNFIKTFDDCTGNYIALCEGDDYWTDPYKLQKQVDFLEANEGFAICHHNMQVIYEDGRKTHLSNPPEQKETTTIEDLAKGNYIHTPSCIFRNGLIKTFPVWFKDAPVGDYVLHMLNARHGMIKYMPDVMGVYRTHSGGMWNNCDFTTQVEMWVRLMDLMKNYFDPKINEILLKKQINDCVYLINQFKDNAEKSKYYSFKLIENDPYFLYKKIEECKQINNDMKGSITYKVGNLIIRYQRYIKKYFLKFLKSQ